MFSTMTLRGVRRVASCAGPPEEDVEAEIAEEIEEGADHEGDDAELTARSAFEDSLMYTSSTLAASRIGPEHEQEESEELGSGPDAQVARLTAQIQRLYADVVRDLDRPARKVWDELYALFQEKMRVDLTDEDRMSSIRRQTKG
eukprot:g21325.t1